MELIIGLIINTFQLAIFVFAAILIPCMVYLINRKKKLFKILLTICLIAELLGILHLTYNPFYSCPKEYREFISEKDEQNITSPAFGTYSTNIPLVRLWVRVKHADKNEIIFETCYFPCIIVGRSLGDGFSTLYPNW